MHHGHSVAAAVTIIATAVVVGLIVMGIAVPVRRIMERRMFAGPALDEWRRARQRLSWTDRWRVGWATMRRRPVGRVELALAQLARARFAQDAAGRLVTKFRWAWRALAILYAVLGAVGIIAGVVGSRSRMRVSDLADGVLFAGLALVWAFALPRSVARQPARMRELRADIVRRHGQTPGTT